MQDKLEIVEVDRVDVDAVLVAFSDGTSTEYTIKELLALGHEREPEGEAAN